MLVERSTDLLDHCSASAQWDSTDDSKSLLLVQRSVAAVTDGISGVDLAGKAQPSISMLTRTSISTFTQPNLAA